MKRPVHTKRPDHTLNLSLIYLVSVLESLCTKDRVSPGEIPYVYIYKVSIRTIIPGYSVTSLTHVITLEAGTICVGDTRAGLTDI